jgi:hypothetical protein
MSQLTLKKLSNLKSQALKRLTYDQGRTGHITRWEKSHGAPLVWGPPSIMTFFFFFFRSAQFVGIS